MPLLPDYYDGLMATLVYSGVACVVGVLVICWSAYREVRRWASR